MRSLILAIVALSATQACRAQGTDTAVALIELLAAKRLECRFGAGTMVDWVDGEPTPAAANWESGVVEISAIDMRSQTARRGDSGMELKVIPTHTGMHLYEFGADGSLTVTTITVAAGRYFAVVSQHADKRPAQYYGVCERVP